MQQHLPSVAGELNDYIDTFIYIVNIYNRSPSKNDIVAAFSGWSMATTAAEAIAEKCDFSEGDTFDGTINPNWYSSSDGEIYTNILENVVLNPGETKEIKLYMYKDKNDVGLYTNNFEISKKYNEFAIEDNNQNNNITGATYVVTKTKTINFVVYVLVIAITLGMLIVILFIAKYFMETGTAKEYEALEKAKEDNK